MNVTVRNGERRGTVTVPASKSEAHRALICAALSENGGEISCDGTSGDIDATVGCLEALGAEIGRRGGTISVKPIKRPAENPALPCGESGSTLRFLLPVAGALKIGATFKASGRLPERPIEPLASCLRSHGMRIEKTDGGFICSGALTPGDYSIPGDVSSQYISGLLFALPLLSGESRLEITGKIESENYIKMTENALAAAEIAYEKRGREYLIKGGQRYVFHGQTVGRDWSGAAFFLCMGALSGGAVTLAGLDESSAQGDREIINVLERFGAKVTRGAGGITVSRGRLSGITLDASMIPDLVPAVAAVAALADGETRITGAGRLRLKESDRLKTTRLMLNSLGGDAAETEDGLIIKGKKRLSGGTVDPYNDHRIAMAAAVAASGCDAPVTVTGAECSEKSYPGFWDDLNSLEVL